MKRIVRVAAVFHAILGHAAAYSLQWDVNSSNFLEYFEFDTVSPWCDKITPSKLLSQI